jgi:hypothetical protein
MKFESTVNYCTLSTGPLADMPWSTEVVGTILYTEPPTYSHCDYIRVIIAHVQARVAQCVASKTFVVLLLDNKDKCSTCPIYSWPGTGSAHQACSFHACMVFIGFVKNAYMH